jgi:uncharacterized membrane protein YvlD (DUF360 family)
VAAAAPSASPTAWRPETPRLHPVRVLAAWAISALALLLAAGAVPGAEIRGTGGAILVAALVAILNAIVPPLLAALRLPLTVALGFLAVLVADAGILLLAADIAPEHLYVSGWGAALAVALIASAVSTAAAAVAGIDDDSTYTYRVARRIARRTGRPETTDAPGLIFLEIDGLALPVLRRAISAGNAPVMGRWLREGGYRLTGWETDLSSQTGASQAGILLGDNDDIPAFRWVDKRTGRVVTCSNPDDCAAIEATRERARALLDGGGTSRGNLLSGGADAAILTVSRLGADKRANPGYRAFLANGANVTRTLVLFLQEVVIELAAAARQRRWNVRPRGHRGGIYPLLRAGMCVFVRDLVVFSVLQDMFRGVPAVYATFPSYDEVAHHSGLERPDTLEALRKLDDRFGMIERARRYAPRPYEIVVLSDHGQTQGETFKQRNGYGLDELVARALSGGRVRGLEGGDENAGGVARALEEATGRVDGSGADEVAVAQDREAVVLGSGNLGLIYLMERPERLTLEAIEQLHPELIPALRAHPHVGFVLVRSEVDGAVALGRDGMRRLADGEVRGTDPLAPFPRTAARHLRRTDRFPHVADLVVNSFYDPVMDEACAFEELISFHGGLGGPQTEPFILHPEQLPLPGAPLVGAESVNRLFRDWRRLITNSVASPGATGKEEQNVPLDGLARAAGPDR